MTKLKKALYCFLAILPLLAAFACTQVTDGLTKAIDVGKAASTQAASVIADVQASIDSLPDADPLRAELQKKLDKAVKAKAEADKAIATAEGVKNSLSTGVLDPTTAGVLSALPYGSYVVTALSLFAFIRKRKEAADTATHLTGVVASLDAVGISEMLNEGEKRQVAAIQGPLTTAAVHDIKAKVATTDIPE